MGFGLSAKKCLFVALSVVETWCVSGAERREVKMLEMKCLRSLSGGS